MKHILYISLFLFSANLLSQNISGKVIEIIDSKEMPIVGANIYLIDNSKGTISDENGNFFISDIGIVNEFIVSYVGYLNDTLKVEKKFSNIILKQSSNLDEIIINYKDKTSSVSLLSSQNVLNISSEELLKSYIEGDLKNVQSWKEYK